MYRIETTNSETWKNLEKQFTKLSCTGWIKDRDNKFWNLEKQFTKIFVDRNK